MSITKEFVMGGDATFTVECPPGAKHPHRTYRVTRMPGTDRWPETYFVKLLTGSDNETSYTYLGILDPNTGSVRVTAKSCRPSHSFTMRLLNRILDRVWREEHEAYLNAGFDARHDGRCSCCGRKLTTPTSLERGIGPECWKKMDVF